MMVLVGLTNGLGTAKPLIEVGGQWCGTHLGFILGLYFHEHKPLCFAHKQCYEFCYVVVQWGFTTQCKNTVKSIALLV